MTTKDTARSEEAVSSEMTTPRGQEEASCSGRDSSRSEYTVAEAIDAAGFGKFQIGLLFYAGSAWMADAMEMMILSFLGPAAACQWGLTPSQEGNLSTVVFAGTLIGANAFGALSDAFGRRVGFFATAVFSSIFGAASALAPSFRWLLVLRFFVGVGLGGAHVPVALYLEYLPTHLRGLMLVALQSFWTIGTMIEAGLGWAILSPLGWRWLLLVSSVPLFLLAALYPVIPESPYWLVAADRGGDAEAALARVARVNGRGLPPGKLKLHAPATVVEGRGSRERLREGLQNMKESMGRIFCSSLGITTALLMIIWFANALTYYGEVLLTTAIHSQSSSACGADGKLELSSKDLSEVFITTIAELPGLIAAALLIDTLGRKRTMLLAMLVIITSTCWLMFSDTHSLAALFTSRAASMGGFTVLFIVTPEMYPTKIRSFALGLNNSMSRLGAILSPLVSVGLTKSGHLRAAEGIIAACCTVAAICICCLPRETSGASLEADDKPVKRSDSGPSSEAEVTEEGEAGGLLPARRVLSA